jgi:addiction module HigA family antidote
MKNPPHPGELIRTEVIEALGLTVSKAAEILQVRRATLSDLLHVQHAPLISFVVQMRRHNDIRV